MKRIFLFATAMVVAMSSCSKNEVLTSNLDNNAVGFGIYTGAAVKGTEVTTDFLKTGSGSTGFGVLAYYHKSTTTDAAAWDDSDTPDFMYNEQVTWDTSSSGAWIYSPVKYWPNNTVDRVSYFAYAPWVNQSSSPKTALSTNATTGVPTITVDYTGAADMVDLVVAQPKYEQAKSSYTSSDITFTFYHVLTRMGITAWVSEDDTYTGELNTNTFVYVTKLLLVGSENTTLFNKSNNSQISSGLYSKNTFTFADKDAAKGTYNSLSQVGSWGTATRQSDNIDLSGVMNLATASQGTYATSSVKVEGTASTSTTNLFKADNYAFLLPPNGTTGIASGSYVRLYVEYDVVTTDASVDGGLTVITNYDIVAIPDEALKAGVAYTINLELALTGVKVSATVDDSWDTTPTSTDIATPATNTTN